MNAELTIDDRFAILEILPSRGNFATAKLVRELLEQLSLTEAEIKEYKVKQVDSQITWENASKTKEMEFGEFATELIKNALIKLNEEKKLDVQRHYSIYEQFVEVK